MIVRFIMIVMSLVSLVGAVYFSTELCLNEGFHNWSTLSQLIFYVAVATVAFCSLIVLSFTDLRDDFRTRKFSKRLHVYFLKHKRGLRRLVKADMFWSALFCWPFVEAESFFAGPEISIRILGYSVIISLLFLGYCDAYLGKGSRVSREGLRRDI